MPLTSAVVVAHDVGGEVGAQWEALCGSCGAQGDFFDSYAWYASLVPHAAPGALDRLRVPAVLDGGRPVAVLLLDVRRTPLTPVALPARSLAAAAAKGVRQRMNRRMRRVLRRSGGRVPPGTTGARQAHPGDSESAEAADAAGTGMTGLPAVRLDLTPPLRRYLALAGGHRGPEAAERAWGEDAEWWRLGGPARPWRSPGSAGPAVGTGAGPAKYGKSSAYGRACDQQMCSGCSRKPLAMR